MAARPSLTLELEAPQAKQALPERSGTAGLHHGVLLGSLPDIPEHPQSARSPPRARMPLAPDSPGKSPSPFSRRHRAGSSPLLPRPAGMRRGSAPMRPFSRVKLARSLSLGSVPDWYLLLHAEDMPFHQEPESPVEEVKEGEVVGPSTAPALERYRSTPVRNAARVNSGRFALREMATPKSEAASESGFTLDSCASERWSAHATPSASLASPVFAHHHLPPSASRTLENSAMATPSLEHGSEASTPGADGFHPPFSPFATFEPLSPVLPFRQPRSSAGRRTHRRNSLSADDIVLRASSLIKDEELLFHPDNRGVTLDDLMLNHMDAGLLAGELPRVAHRSHGFWAPGRGGRRLLRLMGGMASPRAAPRPRRIGTPELDGSDGEKQRPAPTPRHASMPPSTPPRILSNPQPLTFDSAIASINANVDAYNVACDLSKPEPMMTALLAIRGFCQMLVDQKPEGLEGLLPETLKGIADLAALVELYKPRLALVLTVDRYRGLVAEGRSLSKRRGTLLRIEELAMSILHDVAEEGRRIGGVVLHLREDQITALHDARQRARNSQIWLDFVMDMYKALPADSMVERVHASGADEDPESSAPRQLQKEYQLEKYGAPIPIPALFLKPYYDLWEKLRRETGDGISFQHFLYLQILRHKDVVELAESNPNAVEELIKKGIGNGIPDQVTVTYLTTPEQRDIYRASISEGRLFSVNASLGTRRLLDTKRYRTMWRVTGAGYAICVFREAEGLYLADHVTNKFHHSSIFAGEAVDFAGELRVANGLIIEANNKSGHYKPGRRETLKFLLFLHNAGVDLLGVDFRFVSPECLDGEVVDAAEFLRELAPAGSLPPIDEGRRGSGLSLNGTSVGGFSVFGDDASPTARMTLGDSARGMLSNLAEKRVSFGRKVRRVIGKDVVHTDTDLL